MLNVGMIATSLHGGAGIAASRIAESVARNGVNLTIISRDEKPIFNIPNLKIENRVSQFISPILSLAQRKLIQKDLKLVTPLGVDFFQNNLKALRNFDVIHIHASYNFISSSSIYKIGEMGIPTLITLHDQRFLTGGCHYSFTCKEFLRDCANCPQIRKGFQQLATSSLHKTIANFQNIENIAVTTPSEWLLNLAQESRTFHGRSITKINNPIPSTYTFNGNSNPRGKIRIAFSAASLDNPYKGIGILECALKLLTHPRKFELLLIGKGEHPGNFAGIESHSTYSESDIEMSNILNSIDYLIVPSEADNSPNIIGEAICSGTKVIASNAGGTSELINISNGYVFENGNSNQLAEIISQLSHSYDREKVAGSLQSKLNYSSIGSLFSKEYDRLVS